MGFQNPESRNKVVQTKRGEICFTMIEEGKIGRAEDADIYLLYLSNVLDGDVPQSIGVSLY